MSHLVAGYPTDELSFTAARALVEGGADILEIQLPFSDPSADGPAIQGACTKVLERGYRTADGLAFISKLHQEFPQVKIYLMSYGSLVYTPGIENFCKKAAQAGVTGMIIPDLPFDYDEGLTAACRANGMENIPVAAPSMSQERLSKLQNDANELIKEQNALRKQLSMFFGETDDVQENHERSRSRSNDKKSISGDNQNVGSEINNDTQKKIILYESIFRLPE